jgi:hypothetical protein
LVDVFPQYATVVSRIDVRRARRRISCDRRWNLEIVRCSGALSGTTEQLIPPASPANRAPLIRRRISRLPEHADENTFD